MRFSRGTSAVALAAGMLAMVGCYSYAPSVSPAPGTVARVTIPTGSGVAGNGATETARLEGVVVSAGDTIVLAMRIRREWGNEGGTLRADTVRLNRDLVSSIEVKEASRGKTLLLGAAIAGAVTTLALILEVGNQEGVGTVEDDVFPPGGSVITFPVASIIAKLFGGG